MEARGHGIGRRLLARAAVARFALAAALLAGAAGGVLAVAQARVLARVLDGAFLGGRPLDALRPLLWALLAIVVARAASTWLSEVASVHVSSRVRADLRARLLERVVALGPARRPAQRLGELVGVATENVEALDAWYAQYLPQAVLAAVVPATVLVAVLPVDLLSAVVLLVTAPLVPVFMVLVGRLARERTRRQWEELGRLGAVFWDALQGLATLKALGRFHDQAKKLDEAGERYTGSTLSVLRVTFLSALVLEWVTTLSTAVVAVQLGLRLFYARIGFEDAFFVLVVAPEFYLPLRQLGARFHAGMAGAAAARRIFEILDEPAPEPVAAGAAPAAPGRPPTVRFDDVRVRHEGASADALAGATFELPAGATTALAGESGAGKSTCAALLLRFLEPTAGRLLVDGRELRTLDAEAWRARVAWVPQSPHLFHGSVDQNLQFARPGASREELRAAATRAEALGFIEALPDGWATSVGERGARLSAGQAQRIALARAFLRDAPLLVLDEATAHLDAETAQRIDASLAELRRGRTTLVIAHRPAALEQADQVVFLEAGRVAAVGAHRDLLAREPRYRSLVEAWSAQTGSPPAEAPPARPALVPGPAADAATTWAAPVARGAPVLGRLAALARPFAGAAALSLLLGLLTIAAGVGLLATSAYLVATAALRPSFAALQVPVVGVRFFGLARGAFRYLERLVSHAATLRILARLRAWLLRALEPSAPAFLRERRAGDVLARLVGDVSSLESFYVRGLAPPLVAVLAAAAAWLFLASFDPRLAWLVLGFLAAAGLVVPALARALAARPGRATVSLRGALAAGVADLVQGLPEVLAFGRARDRLAELGSAADALRRAQGRLALATALQASLTQLAQGIALWALLPAAIPLVGAALTGVELAVLALATLAVFEAVQPLGPAAQQLAADAQAARRVFELADAPPVAPDPPAPEPPPAGSAVAARGLRFRYPGARAPALDGLDLDLAVGRAVALVGPSGSGKSTLVALLLRFLDGFEGTLSLGGRDVRGLRAADVRARIAAAPADAWVFGGTLRDNLLLARPDADDETLSLAGRAASLSSFVEALPRRWDEPTGEGGLRLSGGERQRLVLARALLRDAPLLVLDEPTAHLDPRTAAEVMRTLRGLAASRALLLVTHRLPGLEWMDEIAVLDAGRVVERGRHDQLLARGGWYARMWRAQAGA